MRQSFERNGKKLALLFSCGVTAWGFSLWILVASSTYVYQVLEHGQLLEGISLGLPFGPDTYLAVFISSIVTLLFVSFLLGLLVSECLYPPRISPKNGDDHSQFLADISHDIRTPLTSVRGYVETLLLKGDAYSPREQKEFLEIIMSNTTQLSKLVDELFDFTKVKDGVRARKFEILDFTELTLSIGRRLAPLAGEKSVDLIVKVDEEPIRVLGDKAMLDRAITNVVNNAIYYTRSGGNVQVEMSKKGKKAFLKVSDSGIGIPEEDLAHIFDRFYRVNKDRSRATGGSGLGLAIAKTVIDAHRGRIQVESAVNVGTKVSIEIPIA